MNNPITFKKWIIVMIISFGFTLLFAILGVAFSGISFITQIDQLAATNFAHNINEIFTEEGLYIDASGADDCENFTLKMGNHTLVEVNCDAQMENSMMDSTHSEDNMMSNDMMSTTDLSEEEIEDYINGVVNTVSISTKSDLDTLLVTISIYGENNNLFESNKAKNYVVDSTEEAVENKLKNNEFVNQNTKDEDFKEYFERTELSNQDVEDYINDYFSIY